MVISRILSLLPIIAMSMLDAHSAGAETVVAASFKDQSPREDVRIKVFPEGSKPRDCKIVSKNPAGLVDVDPGLTAALQTLLRGINLSDDKGLLPLFHPQIKVTTTQIKVALSSIARISGQKLDATLFRAYALNNLTGESGAITCPEDGLLLHPLYGHPLQAGVWIQALGQDEVTRVYVILIPSKDKWQIGAWHVQQWTHAAKDYTAWFDEGKALVAKHDDLAAWLYFDLTEKLLDGGKFIVFPVAKDVVRERDKLLGGKTPTEILASKFPSDKLVYTASLFSRKGAALLLRFQIPGEWSAVAIREHCRAKFKALSQEPWMKPMAGIRCSYVLPVESPSKEGVLGGIFIE
jgi:hypothetical protein